MDEIDISRTRIKIRRALEKSQTILSEAWQAFLFGKYPSALRKLDEIKLNVDMAACDIDAWLLRPDERE